MFADEAAIPHATLLRLENGLRIPNILTLKKIAVSMNLELCDLIFKIEENIPEKIKNFEF